MSGSSIPSIEKLKGRENYDTWKFAVQNYLEHEELWNCIVGEEVDAKKVTKEKANIVLLIDPINYVHVQTAATAKEAWDFLQQAFQDTGLTRRVGLLKTLITTKLDESKSVEDYVNKVVSTTHKLRGVGMDVSDIWIGTLLLADLPIEYQPMIMGIESSGIAITADSIKTKLLQDVKIDCNADVTNVALYGHNQQNRSTNSSIKPNKKNKGPLCYECKGHGHIARNCP